MEAGRYTVPPHTLLIVMEQVLENNTMSAARPLRITLSQADGTLQIRHSNQPKANTEEQSPQFRFLLEQFRFLNKEISITTEDQEVFFTIPLLPA